LIRSPNEPKKKRNIEHFGIIIVDVNLSALALFMFKSWLHIDRVY
jgi:hypothetical protein